MDKCIGEVLDDTAKKYPDQDCLIVRHQNQRYTYRQFRERVDLAARAFLHLGINKRDRVGTLPRRENPTPGATGRFHTA